MQLALALVFAVAAAAGGSTPPATAPTTKPATTTKPAKGKPKAGAPEAAAIKKEPAIILQLDVVDGAIDAAERVRVEDAIAAFVSRHQRLDAVTQREVKRIVDLEAARASVGCDDEGCAAEIGAALGARWLVGGRIERASSQMILSLSLFDATAAKVVKRATARGARFSDVRVQLPFTVDAIVEDLKSPGDPAPGDLLEEARAKLALLPEHLPPKLDGAPQKGGRTAFLQAALDDAAGLAAQKLNLALLGRDDVNEIAKGAHCKPDDARCTLPAAAAKGAALGLGVSVTPTSVRATLLQPDGTVVAVGERPIAANGADLADAVRGAVLDAAGKRLGMVNVAAAQSSSSSSSSSTTASSVFAAADDENILTESGCNLLRGLESVGSRCTLTNKRLHIQPHALSIQSQPEDILLDDVDAVDPVPVLGFIPTGVKVTMKSGAVRNLVVQDRDRLIHLMRERR